MIAGRCGQGFDRIDTSADREPIRFAFCVRGCVEASAGDAAPGRLALENEVSLLAEIVQPLVEHDVSPPAIIELSSMRTPDSAQLGMSMIVAERHRFCELAIEVYPQFHIRIGDTSSVLEKEIRQRERNRMTRPLQNLYMISQ